MRVCDVSASQVNLRNVGRRFCATCMSPTLGTESAAASVVLNDVGHVRSCAEQKQTHKQE